LVVPAAGLFSLPEAEPQQLAMLGINPPTASLLLDEASDLKPGDWVVQNAANSVVAAAPGAAGVRGWGFMCHML
jgi:NADPH:quinone reductase-like Zn-dependent oxidoreductase